MPARARSARDLRDKINAWFHKNLNYELRVFLGSPGTEALDLNLVGFTRFLKKI